MISFTRGMIIAGALSLALAAACSSDDSRPKQLQNTGATGGTGGGGTGGGGTGGAAGTDAGAGDADVDSSLPANCTNGTQDGDETDVDCGGSCAGCAATKKCGLDADCASKLCDASSKVCKAATCADSVQNGTETDVDCGGPNCDPCDDGKTCTLGNDCKSQVCEGTPSKCSAPSCGDNKKNGQETDTDCGGPACKDCNLGQGCAANTDCASGNCQTGQCQCPTGMVIAPATGGGAYCVDKYEVTYADYTKFWQANPSPALQAPECQWNTTYTPPANWPAPVGMDKWPVTAVDYCDAVAYCKWAGKRLCGKVGGGGSAFSQYADNKESQWFNACSAGSNTYPYGTQYKSDICIGNDFVEFVSSVQIKGSDGPFPGDRVATTSPIAMPSQKCQGTAPGLFDMSGNVAEWEDSCDTTSGALDNCRIRGGSNKDGDQALKCNADRIEKRNANPTDVGIRCCSP